MKLIIEVTEDYYKHLKDKKHNHKATIADATILDGIPYEERPTGKWIVGDYQDCHSDILPTYTCPFCGEIEYRKYDFCHCGVDMREKNEQ